MKKTMDALLWTVVLLLVGGVATMAALGWLSVDNTDHETNIRIDREEIREDIDKAVEQGKKLLEPKPDEGNDNRPDDGVKHDKDAEPRAQDVR